MAVRLSALRPGRPLVPTNIITRRKLLYKYLVFRLIRELNSL
jgi:hypothetical protein